ncbi:MAG: hypothetical protein U5L11_12680 [Arhodomonas sp.]|nr:hypothetical protein [Arhodomonas sp.]
MIRALERLGLADSFGNTRIPLYVLNVTYPLVDDEVLAFCAGKDAVLMIEEGQPDYIEQAVHAVLRNGRARLPSARQGHAARGRRVRRPADDRRELQCLAVASTCPSSRDAALEADRRRRCSNSPRPCRRARRGSAPAARSAPSSPP